MGMKKNYNINYMIILAGFTILMQACSGSKTKNPDTQVLIPADSNRDQTGPKESVFYLMPSPGEILLRIYSSDIPYKPDLLNHASNKDKYLGSRNQSLNLGVYITDMAYSALFERSGEIVEYLESVQFLSTEAGISSGIFESLLSRAKVNASDMDSLINLANEAYTGMVEFLETGGQEASVMRISAGAFIEGLYIAVESAGTYSADNKIIGMLSELEYPLENLIARFRSNPVPAEDQELVQSLEAVKFLFSRVNKEQKETIVKDNKPGSIRIEGGKTAIMTEDIFLELRKKVSALRNETVSF
jgi:hypothetical protein